MALESRASDRDWRITISEPGVGAPVRHRFRAHLERYATADSDLFGAELIFAELLSNVVRHARGPVSFQLGWARARPTLLVTDAGEGFRSRPACMLSDDPQAENGRGLGLVRRLAVRMKVGNRPAGGAFVLAVLPVRCAKGAA